MIPAATLFEPLPIKAVGRAICAPPALPLPPMCPRGESCVLLNGQTEFIEKYFEMIDELRGRGFAVATMDWRGQGGSSRMTKDSRKSFVGDFCEYDQDLDTLMNWIVTPMLGPGEKPRGAGPFHGRTQSAAQAGQAPRQLQGLRAQRAHDRDFLPRPARIPGPRGDRLPDVAGQARRLGVGHGSA